MKAIIDKFSKQSNVYKKYRPTYPDEIYRTLLKYVTVKNKAWDCGTGNGQVAIQLAKYFQEVYATDISQNQLNNAEEHPKIVYKVERAEKSNFLSNQFDLITIAQAIHWFDIQAFNNEVRRVCKNGGIISFWGYGLLRIDPKIDQLIDKFYYDIVGPYWNTERKYIDAAYQTIEFDFIELPTIKNKFIHSNWTINQLEGYFNSWSSVQNFKEDNPGIDPVNTIILEIKKYWLEAEIKAVKSPMFIRVGRIEK